MNIECGFAAVNDGKHCFIHGRCVSCGTSQLDYYDLDKDDFDDPIELEETK